MPAPLILTFVSTVAFAVQLLIFAYLYSSHRVRFFQYLLLAWGAYTLSKGLKLVDVLVLGVDHPSFVTDLTTVAAVGFTLAAAFAHRWSYRLNARDVLIGTAVAVGLTLAGDVSVDETQRAVGITLGVVQMAAGFLFWPFQSRMTRFRGERLLAGFLQFARAQQARRAPGDIREVVQHVSSLIREDRSRAPRVDVRVAVDPAVPRFAFDRDQVTQVLWNVALNAVEAMNGRGRLSLEVNRRNGDVPLSVSDTGPGIAPENLPTVFEPFYTGKPNGSGPGLTIAERIVDAHG